MKRVWVDEKAKKALTPELKNRLYYKIYDITNDILDIRDKILDIYEVLDNFIDSERGQMYCLRLLRQLDCPIRNIRRAVIDENYSIIYPAKSRVRKEIIDIMKKHQL